MASEFKVLGQFKNEYEVIRAFNQYPKAMEQTIRRWFYMIKRRYVGNAKRDGSYVRWLKNRKLKNRDGKWSKSAANAFKGFVKFPDNLSQMKLVMGIPENSDSGFIEGMHKRSVGPYPISSSKFMPVPVYKKAESLGIVSKYYANFKKLIKNNELTFVRNKGRVFWILKSDREEGGVHEEAVYIGVKRVQIPKYNFKFEEKFKKIWPRMVALGEKRVERTVRNIEKGFIKAN